MGNSNNEQLMMSTIKKISEIFVKPKHDVEAEKQIHYLGSIDTVMLSIDPIQKGLLFTLNNPTSHIETNITSLLGKLNRSLSLALLHYYPLAGQLETKRYEEKHACWVYVDCSKGPGARLLHATAMHLTVSDILSSTDVHPAVRFFFDLGEKLVNHDGHTKPLLSIQVTELSDGVFLGFTMNHSVVDGTTFMNFLTTLSEIFTTHGGGGGGRGGEVEGTVQISRVPLYKPFLLDGYGPSPIIKLPYLDPDEFLTRYDPGPLRERIFHFSYTSMGKLKCKANEECGPGAHSISSFQALSGLVWKSIIRARAPPSDHGTACCLLVNARSRLRPPLSDDYFGNFIYQARETCKVGELLGHHLGLVAMGLHNAIRACDDKKIQVGLKWFPDNPCVVRPGWEKEQLYGPNTVLIGGSPRFDLFRAEFGPVRAVAVRNGYPNKDDGKVTASQGCEKGSVDLEICLRPQIMATLEMDEEFMSFVS